jgi:response regulator of citrate/malate metabolism
VITTLVVDDDFRVAALHAEFVARVEGFEVVGVAHSGRGAVEIAARLRPDLVLLDLYLPDESGLSVLRQLRDGDGPHPDVVAVTAARDLASIRTAMQRGVVSYLVKPFGFRALAGRLDAYRGLWQQAHRGGEVGQQDVDRLFGMMRPAGGSPLPKGHSEPTMAVVRAAFDAPGADLSAAEIAEVTGISRATAQRYLTLLTRSGELQLHLRYGSTGRPEHRYRRKA